jgi:hypothetical protein
MLSDRLPDLAVRGEAGIEVYERQDLPDQRRGRFRCLGAVGPDGRAWPYEAGVTPARLVAAAAALPPDGLALDLADATSFPAPGADPLMLMLRIDFLRARTLAAQVAARFAAALARDAAAAVAEAGPFAAQVAAVYDFNRLAIGAALARAALPALPERMEDGHGFALRMLGDLALRGGEARLALACFEAALAAGDNPHRRARARAAAEALGDQAALARHGGAGAVA